MISVLMDPFLLRIYSIVIFLASLYFQLMNLSLEVIELNYLINYKGFPKGLLANEVKISLNNTIKRCDTVLYSRDMSAKLIVEYKAPHIHITQAVFDQITRYNMVLKVEYLIVTNGINHYCCKINYTDGSYSFINEIPSYDTL